MSWFWSRFGPTSMELSAASGAALRVCTDQVTAKTDEQNATKGATHIGPLPALFAAMLVYRVHTRSAVPLAALNSMLVGPKRDQNRAIQRL